MPSKGRADIQIINKNGTPVEVTDDNRLKVETSSPSAATPGVLDITGATHLYVLQVLLI